VASLRVEGPDQPGLGARMCQAVGNAGVNLRGVSALALDHKFVAYLGFDRAADAEKARPPSRPCLANSRSPVPPPPRPRRPLAAGSGNPYFFHGAGTTR